MKVVLVRGQVILIRKFYRWRTIDSKNPFLRNFQRHKNYQNFDENRLTIIIKLCKDIIFMVITPFLVIQKLIFGWITAQNLLRKLNHWKHQKYWKNFRLLASQQGKSSLSKNKSIIQNFWISKPYLLVYLPMKFYDVSFHNPERIQENQEILHK